MLSVGVVGASGYTGAELLRLLAAHPQMRLAVATADSQAGRRVAELYPSFAGIHDSLRFASLDDLDTVDGLDVVFLGLPHLASATLAPELVGRVGVVVDLSAAFRLRDLDCYPEYYAFDHPAPELVAQAVYGLPEKYRDELRRAALIATPGCYVTAATLALEPLVRAGLVDDAPLIVDAASGVSGAGREPTATNIFSAVDGDLAAYGLLSHRHTPEMEQEIGAQVLFTPHLVPMTRGILATCYVRPDTEGGLPSTDDVLGLLRDRYRDEPFVVVIDDPPHTKATLGSNCVHLSARTDVRTGTIIVLAALDNLTKGASGGALQSANLALGLDETAGLPLVGMMP